jgi:hypothetical protein
MTCGGGGGGRGSSNASNNVSLASSLYALAGVYFYLGNHYKAYELDNKTIEMLTLIYDEDTPPPSYAFLVPLPLPRVCHHHPLLADALNNLGMLLTIQRVNDYAQQILCHHSPLSCPARII